MSAPRKWEVLTTAPDLPSAHVLAQILTAQGVPSHVVPDSTLLGQAMPCRVMIDSALAHRARWVMSQSQFSDEELTFLATGGASCDAAKE
jgi:hypothetical protein